MQPDVSVLDIDMPCYEIGGLQPQRLLLVSKDLAIVTITWYYTR